MEHLELIKQGLTTISTLALNNPVRTKEVKDKITKTYTLMNECLDELILEARENAIKEVIEWINENMLATEQDRKSFVGVILNALIKGINEDLLCKSSKKN